jgi:hypothetical protein
MQANDPERQEAVKRLTAQAKNDAQQNGHQMGAWRWVSQSGGMWAGLTCECATCGADVVIVPHTDPVGINESQRRALDWQCPN